LMEGPAQEAPVEVHGSGLFFKTTWSNRGGGKERGNTGEKGKLGSKAPVYRRGRPR